MNTEEKLPERKGTRLHNFDYGSTGAYFVTVCTQGRQRVLSEIVVPDHTATNCSQNLRAVGEGLAPPATKKEYQNLTVTKSVVDSNSVGDGALDVPQIRLSKLQGGDLLFLPHRP